MKLQKTAERAAGEQRSCGSINQRAKTMAESSGRIGRQLQIQRILVPVDFSEPSKKALQYAITVASEFGAELILLHVVHPYPILPDLPPATVELNAILRKEATTDLKKVADTVKAALVKQVIRVGNPAREIVDEADKQEADLIIISTHGRTGLSHLVIGSVAEQVVRLAKCPVLTLRQGGRDFVTIGVDDAELNRLGAQILSR